MTTAASDIAAKSVRTTIAAALGGATSSSRKRGGRGNSRPPLFEKRHVSRAPDLIRNRAAEERFEHTSGCRPVDPGEQARGRGQKVGQQFLVGASESQGLLEGEDHPLGLRAAQVLPQLGGEAL